MFNNSHKTGSRSGLAGVWIPAFGATQRIRFSSMVTILPFRHPLLVARGAAMLDNFTSVCFDVGRGRGLRPPEFEASGVDQEQSREMFLESFVIIRRVWADENFAHLAVLDDP